MGFNSAFKGFIVTAYRVGLPDTSVVQSGECFEGMLLTSLVFCVVFVVVLLGAFAKLRKATVSFVNVCLSVWNNSAPTGRIFMKFGI